MECRVSSLTFPAVPPPCFISRAFVVPTSHEDYSTLALPLRLRLAGAEGPQVDIVFQKFEGNTFYHISLLRSETRGCANPKLTHNTGNQVVG